MLAKVHSRAKWLLGVSVGAIAQDKFGGLSLGRWMYLAAALVAVAVLLVFATWAPISDRLLWWRKPKLEVVGVGNFYRSAIGSKASDDLQVIYARIRNRRDGGGERATLRDAEAWLTLVDEEGREIGHGNQGNWLNVRSGTPDPRTLQQATFRPNHEQFALEIASKFKGTRNAWMAGALHENLPPGVHRIQARITDGAGLHKATVFQWEITNPEDGDLWTAALGTDPPETPPSLPPAYPSFVTTEIISFSASAASGTALPPEAGFPASPEQHDSVFPLLAAKRAEAAASAYRHTLQTVKPIRDEIVARLQGAPPADPAVYERAGAWCNRCVLWVSDLDLQVTAEERSQVTGQPTAELSNAEWLARIDSNVAALKEIGARLGL